MTQGSNNLHFFYGADGSPAMVVYNGAGYGYVKNLQGDIVSIVNSSGTEVVHYSYDAWGKLLSKTGTLATSLGTLNPFRYRGYVYDEETGLYYLRSRYYNPNLCRFITSDNLLNGKTIADNIYTYCANRPVRLVDNDGHNGVDSICNAIMDAIEWAFPGSKARANKVLSGNASFGDVLDWLTLGYTGTVYRATHPKEPLSFQHWSDSFVAVAVPFGLYRRFVPKPMPTVTWPAEAINPLSGTQYTEKVLNQMNRDIYHGFPRLIDSMADISHTTTITGGDGITYTLVRIPGAINTGGKWIEGFFEYIISPEGLINHRFFNFK